MLTAFGIAPLQKDMKTSCLSSIPFTTFIRNGFAAFTCSSLSWNL